VVSGEFAHAPSAAGTRYCAAGERVVTVLPRSNANLGSLDAPDQLMPTYESWIVRRESWLPPFPLTRRYDRDRDATGRSEE
jgi:hypothetical protein